MSYKRRDRKDNCHRKRRAKYNLRDKKGEDQ